MQSRFHTQILVSVIVLTTIGLMPAIVQAAGESAATRLQLTVEGPGLGALGNSVSDAGDVNGDGFADFIVGEDFSNLSFNDAGAAYVYYGGPILDTTADLVFTGEAVLDRFGESVSGAGDVNGDGYDDLIVGTSNGGGSSSGRAYLFFGGPGADAVADAVFMGSPGDRLGASVSGAGDVNGDGFDDIIVGAFTTSAEGRAYVYFGGVAPDTTADMVLSGEAVSDWFGESVSGAGDVNQDGFDDVIVGARFHDTAGISSGRAYVYFGGVVPNTAADVVMDGEDAGIEFGQSVSGAGDIDGDGFADVIVGAVNASNGSVSSGCAYLFRGGDPPNNVPDVILSGEGPGDDYGISVSGAGDVNRDGMDDIIVGANLNDALDTSAGRAYVYFGSNVMDSIADILFTGEANGDQFGISVSGAGDVNGDGFADLLAGAPFNDEVTNSSGRAYLYDCNRYFIGSPTGGDTWNVGASEVISWSGAEPADIWLSSDGGNSYSQLRSNVGGNAANVAVVTVPHQPTRFGKIKITPYVASVAGHGETDSLFTIEASIALLNLKAEPVDRGGVLLSWETDPGPEDLAGYRIERSPVESETWAVVAALVREVSYHDVSGTFGMRYRLTAINGLGEELLLGETALTPPAVLAAWPLPYHGGKLTVSFLTASGLGDRPSPAEVAIFDLQGRRVRTLARGDFNAGAQTATWDGRDDTGRSVSSGVYFIQAVSAGTITKIKLAVIR